MNTPFIPRRTCAKIQNPAPLGQRHEQAKRIALSLIGQGLSPDAVFSQLRGMYGPDVSDREIRNLIAWASARNPQPCGYGGAAGQSFLSSPPVVLPAPARVTPEQAVCNAKNFLGDWHCTIADLWHASPWRPNEDWRKDSSLLIAALYEPNDYINVVTDFSVETHKDGKQKANLRGAGKTLLRDDWLRHLRKHGTRESTAGCWIRPNPVRRVRGSGHNGAHTDRDVAVFRNLLLESDDLPIGLQLSLWSRLALPVAAIIASGGRSVHAWLKVDCRDAQEYQGTATQIYELLARFNPCPSNKNPSRLARLPGVKRQIGGIGASEQRLYYLNDDPSGKPIFEKGISLWE
jgi:hypothetical protein